jgi:hypothetical protein
MVCKFFVVLYGTGVGTQGFSLAIQTFYHLSHAPSLFCSGYFGNRVLLFFLGQPSSLFSYFRLPAVAGM